MIRVLGGSIKGKKLLSPKGLTFRPATGRVKELIFSLLGKEIEGACVLDLFAGTGALGIEALSRGAIRCVFVERAFGSLKLIEKNVNTCQLSQFSQIIQGDVFQSLARLDIQQERFQIILADPPFKSSLRQRIVETVEGLNILQDAGYLVVEHDVHDTDHGKHRLQLVKQRRFGQLTVSIYK